MKAGNLIIRNGTTYICKPSDRKLAEISGYWISVTTRVADPWEKRTRIRKRTSIKKSLFRIRPNEINNYFCSQYICVITPIQKLRPINIERIKSILEGIWICLDYNRIRLWPTHPDPQSWLKPSIVFAGTSREEKVTGVTGEWMTEWRTWSIY